MIEIRDAHIDDAENIEVREGDCREIWRTCMSRPNTAVALAIISSREAYTALLDGEIICIFGVATTSVINQIGAPWLIGSNLVTEVPRRFLSESRKRTRLMLDGYALFRNYVDADNVVSIRWLKWLGFKIDDEAKPYGPVQKPFRCFTMESV